MFLNVFTHRLSFFINKHPFKNSLFVCHKCDNPPCVNPNHLFLGTNKDNLQDASKKGRLKHSNETKSKISNSLKKYFKENPIKSFSPEHKQNISKSAKNRKRRRLWDMMITNRYIAFNYKFMIENNLHPNSSLSISIKE